MFCEGHGEDLLAVRLHGFGVLEVHLRRGDIWEQFSYLQPERKAGIKRRRSKKFPEYGENAVVSSPVLGPNVDRCSLVIILAFLVELSSFRELL